MTFPSFVDELHLAEPSCPLVLDFDFFDQPAWAATAVLMQAMT